MQMRKYLLEQGFSRVAVLSAAEGGLPAEESTLYLCLWGYEGAETPGRDRAAVHPYYPAAQKAYRAARQAVDEGARRRLHLRQDTTLRLKPIFMRLAGFLQGYHTLTAAEGLGTRFHVQAIFQREEAPAYDDLWQTSPHPLSCGSCRACIRACPTGAITETGFLRERCLRNWMLSGQIVPADLREKMGNLLLGCDACQRCCPYNANKALLICPSFPLCDLLASPKESARALRETLGANLALPNRVLAQACLLAANSGDTSLLPLLRPLAEHPSVTVRTHALWAAERLEE